MPASPRDMICKQLGITVQEYARLRARLIAEQLATAILDTKLKLVQSTVTQIEAKAL